MSEQKKIVVCIDAHPKTNILIRAALNKAQESDAALIVLYVETPDHFSYDSESRERVLRFMTYAEEIGAEVIKIEHKSAHDGITSYVLADENNVKTLILGQVMKEGFFAELKASLAERVMRTLGNATIEVQAIPLAAKQYMPSWYDRLRLNEVRFSDILFGCLAIAFAYIATEILHMNVSNSEWIKHIKNVSAFFLLATVVTSLRCGLIASMITAVASFSIINYLYTKPLYSFAIHDAADALALTVFFLTAGAASMLGSFSRAGTLALVRKERRSQALYRIHRIASQATTRNQAMEMMHDELSSLLEMEVGFFMPSSMDVNNVAPTYPADLTLKDIDEEALIDCWKELHTTGLGTLKRFKSSWRFEPMCTTNDEIGVLGINVPSNIHLDASFGRLMSALADQAAAILERIEMSQLMTESHIREEREKLRSMLLSSVSHDLKTPLASIIGSMSVYQRMRKSGRLTPETADELVDTSLEEAQRLDSFISNILNMTRIESGDIEFESEWVPCDEPFAGVQKRLHQRLKQHSLVIEPTEPSCEVAMDQMMTEQVLQNVIDNAAKYSPKHTEIIVSGAMQENGFVYQVRDHGVGIPEDKLESIFDKYERLRHTDSQVAGTGLGLAIGRAIMEKQGGNLTVKNHPEGGAVFSLFLPKARPTQDEKLDIAVGG